MIALDLAATGIGALILYGTLIAGPWDKERGLASLLAVGGLAWLTMRVWLLQLGGAP